MIDGATAARTRATFACANQIIMCVCAREAVVSVSACAGHKVRLARQLGALLCTGECAARARTMQQRRRQWRQPRAANLISGDEQTSERASARATKPLSTARRTKSRLKCARLVFVLCVRACVRARTAAICCSHCAPLWHCASLIRTYIGTEARSK